MCPWRTRQGNKETPLHTYKPLPDKVTIKMSPIHGLGLFAEDTIKEGELLGMVHYPTVDGNDAIQTPSGGFGNHSDNPNCEKIVSAQDGSWWVRTIRDIEPDEEITWTYTLYNPHTPITP